MRRTFLCHLAAATALWAAPRPAIGGAADSWQGASEAFARYVESRARVLPESELRIDSDGRISHADIQGKTHSGLEFYHSGTLILSMMASQGANVFGSGRTRRFPPGIYAACMETTTFRGYQHLLPIVWFEVTEGTASRIRTIDPPKPGEGVWPNERLLLFKDFQLFRGAHRDVIDSRNIIAKPSVELRVDARGAIHIARPEGSDNLHWLIYHDGLLVESGPVGPENTVPPPRDWGNWLAIIGTRTPEGFFPVSNYLHFPLFPGPDNALEVIPAGIVGNHPPSCFDDIPRVGSDYDPDADDDGDGLTNAEEAGAPPPALAPRNDTERRLVQLWQAWSYELRDLQARPRDFPWYLPPPDSTLD